MWIPTYHAFPSRAAFLAACDTAGWHSALTVIGWCGIPSQPRYQARRTDPRVFHGWVSEQVQCMVWAQELPAQGCTQLCSEEP